MSEEQVLNEMPQEDMEYSIASQIAYTYYDNGNDADATQEALDNYIEGYKLDTELSNDNAVTITRPDGSAILAYRGTRPTNIDDLNADAAILAGQHRTDTPHPRFIQALDQYNLVSQKYENVDLTGHSLGGTLADYVGRMNDEKAIVYNPGESPFSLSVIPKSETSKTKIYITNTFDLVSFANSMYPHAQAIRVVPQTQPIQNWIGSHDLENFLPRQSMLPISTEPDIIIPSFIPISVAEKDRKIIQEEPFISNICMVRPDLLECQERKSKKKLIT